MSCALRDVVSIATTIKTRRLPSPTAATGHVLNRIMTSDPNAQANPCGQQQASGEGGSLLWKSQAIGCDGAARTRPCRRPPPSPRWFHVSPVEQAGTRVGSSLKNLRKAGTFSHDSAGNRPSFCLASRANVQARCGVVSTHRRAVTARVRGLLPVSLASREFWSSGCTRASSKPLVSNSDSAYTGCYWLDRVKGAAGSAAG